MFLNVFVQAGHFGIFGIFDLSPILSVLFRMPVFFMVFGFCAAMLPFLAPALWRVRRPMIGGAAIPGPRSKARCLPDLVRGWPASFGTGFGHHAAGLPLIAVFAWTMHRTGPVLRGMRRIIHIAAAAYLAVFILNAVAFLMIPVPMVILGYLMHLHVAGTAPRLSFRFNGRWSAANVSQAPAGQKA